MGSKSSPVDLRLAGVNEKHPLDHEGGDSTLWRLYRDCVEATACMHRLQGIYDAVLPDNDADLRDLIRQEDH